MEDVEKIFEFLHEIGKLKSTYRFSENKQISKESSADHSWRLALMTFTVSDLLKLKIDINKAVKIAIIHDIAESITGDVDYRLIFTGKISKEDKQKEEAEAIKKLKEKLPGKIGEGIEELWNDYEHGLSQEAKYVKALDKLETLTYVVEEGQKSLDYPGMVATYADKAVHNFPELKPMLRILKQKLKKEFEKGGIEWKREYDN